MLKTDDLEAFRIKQKLTKREFCEKLSISESYYYKILSKQTEIPKHFDYLLSIIYFNLPKWTKLNTIIE